MRGCTARCLRCDRFKGILMRMKVFLTAAAGLCAGFLVFMSLALLVSGSDFVYQGF